MKPRFSERTLFSALNGAGRAFGHRTPILTDARDNTVSYGKLIRMSVALGRLLARHTVEFERVGVLLPNLVLTVGLMVGLSAWRRVPAMLNYSADAEAVSHACHVATVRVVVTSREFIAAASLESSVAALDGVRILYLEDLKREITWRDRWHAVIVTALGRWHFIDRGVPDDPAIVLFTSGSEGVAKGVALSHRAILSNIEQMRMVFPFDRNDKFFSPLPVYHSYGLTACLLMPLMAGTPIHLYISPLHYHEIPELVHRHDCRVLFGTSTFLGHYARQADVADFALLKYVVSGGERLDESVASLWQKRFGLPIYDGYGCTECAPVIALNTPTAHSAQTVGRILPGIEYRLLPTAGLDRGGRLLVRGPNLMLGYYLRERPGELQPPHADFGEGWHDTGDIVEITKENYLIIVGRAKRFVKIAGEMIALDTVEHIARRASAGHEHAAVAEFIPGGGESTALFTTDPELSRGRLQQTARQFGSPHLAVARRIIHVSELPRSSSGKTDYMKLGSLMTRS